MLCGLVPNRSWTGTGPWPKGWRRLLYKPQTNRGQHKHIVLAGPSLTRFIHILYLIFVTTQISERFPEVRVGGGVFVFHVCVKRFIDVQLIHNAVLIPAEQQCLSCACLLFHTFSIVVYHRIANIVPCAVQ